MSEKPEELKIVAVTTFNSGEAWVLNRPIKFLYYKSGMDYIGTDGPFSEVLVYEPRSGNAFAGRPIHITMMDGLEVVLKDKWFLGGRKDYVSVTLGDVESLKRCYVMYGATIHSKQIEKFRSQYTGPVYPYRDYEKLIKYDDLWNKYLEADALRCKRIKFLENKCFCLTKEVKGIYKKIREVVSK